MSKIARITRICALLLAFAVVSAMAECNGPADSGRSGTSQPGSDGGY